MSKTEKLLRRLLAVPKDFTWDELVSLMTANGFELHTTSGSGRKFIHTVTAYPFALHEPHPANILKPYAVRQAIKALTDVGAI